MQPDPWNQGNPNAYQGQQQPDGTLYGINPANQPIYPQDPYGQPVYPQDPYGQPVYPQNSYGRPPYPQDSYGQSPYPQNPYGQPVYPQNPYGYEAPNGYGQPVNAYPPQPAPDPYGNPSAEYDSYLNAQPDAAQQDQPRPEGKKARKVKKSSGSQKKNGGRGWIVLLAVVLAAAVLIFISGRPSDSTPKTAVIEMGKMGANYSGSALIVRDENAYSEEGVQTIEYVADEGSIVARGDVICRIYSTGYSAKETTTLQNYRTQIKEYQQSLLASESSYDQKMTNLESAVVEKGLEVRSLVQGTQGSMKTQETLLEQAITERQNYFRSKYSSDMRMDRLFDDEESQLQRIESWIKQKIATYESVVSFYTDGFESVLTPDLYLSYSPSEVRSMIRGIHPETSSADKGRTDLYRLIKQNDFAVLLLVDDTGWNPKEGNNYKLVLEQYTNTAFDAIVLSTTRAGGDLLVRLAVMGDVQQVLYTRSCTAQIGDFVDCMMVPEEALYEQDGETGVVILQDQLSLFTPVEVLDQSGGKAYISAKKTGTLQSGMTVRLFQ